MIAAPTAPSATKAWATFRARAAMAGHTAIKVENGWITVGRWGRTLSFATLGEAESWLDRMLVGGRP